MWAGDIEEYSQHYRVYAVDLPGEPGKSTSKRLDWASPDYTEWLEDVFAALQIERASLIGFSQGGWTALKFSIAHPERVRKLVLLSPGGIAPDKLSFVLKAIPLSMMGDRGIRRLNRLLSGDQDIPSEVDQALTLITTYFKPRVAPLPIFTDQELQCLNMPVLVLMGNRDALRNGQKINARMQKQVTNVQTVIIPGGGHALFNTTGQILPFLDRDADGEGYIGAEI
jgi:pimeloyl-ACP methyl ester carboxylesterase